MQAADCGHSDLNSTLPRIAAGASSRAMSPAQFIERRIVRIVPLYWALTVPTALVSLDGGFHFGPTADFGSLARSFLFIPEWNEKLGMVTPILMVGWTLNLEMFFYAAFALALGRPRAATFVLAALFLLALAATPFVAAALPVETVFDNGSVAPASWEQRLVVWREAGARALGECWPVGCGADYARAWSNEGAMINVPGSAVPLPAMPTHPHNLFLQIWLELGAPGVIFFAVAIVAGVIALRRARLDALTMAAIAGAAGFSFISVMIEFSLWQVWRMAVFALAAFGAAVSYSFNKLKQ